MTRFHIAVFDSNEFVRASMCSLFAQLTSSKHIYLVESFTKLSSMKERLSEQHFDLICSDLSDQQPDDRLGLSLMRIIVAEGQGPLLFVGGAPASPFRGLVKAAGAFDYVEKSAPDGEIIALVRHALGI